MWSPYLTRLGKQYGGQAALILHDFKRQAGEIVDAGENVPRILRPVYARVARNHPWAQYMWRESIGTAIFPDERRVYDRVVQNRNIDAFIRALRRYNLPIGMGAIVWKDKHPSPRHVFVVAIVRPGDPDKGDAFNREEKDLFACQIPALVEKIQSHNRVIKIRHEMNNIKERQLLPDDQNDGKRR